MIYGETERSEDKRDKTMELGNRCGNSDKGENSGLKHLNEEQGEQWSIVATGEKMHKLGPIK